MNNLFFILTVTGWISCCFPLHPFWKLLPSESVTLLLIGSLIFLTVSSQSPSWALLPPSSTQFGEFHSWPQFWLLCRALCEFIYPHVFINSVLTINCTFPAKTLLQPLETHHSIASSAVIWVCVCMQTLSGLLSGFSISSLGTLKWILHVSNWPKLQIQPFHCHP